MSGSSGERLAEVTAIGRSLPAFACGSADGRLSNMIAICPPSRSLTAGALPLYGTCVRSTFAIVLNSSHERWIDVPLPDEPQVTLPGLAFAYAIISCTVLNGCDGCA